MKTYYKTIAICLTSSVLGAYAVQCFDSPPVDQLSTAEYFGSEIRKMPLILSGAYGYFSLENIGGENFDASLFYPQDGKYCIVSLGPMSDVKQNKKLSSSVYYGFDVISKSGSDHFNRSYKYSNGTFVNVSCKVTNDRIKSRSCPLIK